MDAVATVELEVRELIRRRAIDPMQDVLGTRRIVEEAVADYDERAMSGGLPALPDLDEAVKTITDAVAGFGQLQKYFDDPSVEEIWINEPDAGHGAWSNLDGAGAAVAGCLRLGNQHAVQCGSRKSLGVGSLRGPGGVVLVRRRDS